MGKIFFTTLILCSVGAWLPAQVDLDSLWRVWDNANISDTSRLAAMHDISKKGFLYSDPDSAFHLAALQVDLAMRAGNALYHGEGVNTQGISFAVRGDMDRALEYFEEALQIYQQGGLQGKTASALYNIGNVYARRGDPEKALEYMERSLELSKEHGNVQGMTRGYHGMGRHFERNGDYVKALENYQLSLEAHKKIDDKRGEVVTLISIGVVHKLKGDHARAIEVLSQALSIAELINDQGNIGYCLDNIGNIHARQGEPEKAMEYYLLAYEHAQQVEDKEGIAHALMNMGNALADQGEQNSAKQRFEEALVLSEEMGDGNSMAIIHNSLSMVLSDMGLYQEALEHAEEGLRMKREQGFQKGVPNSLVNISSILMRMGQYHEALPYAQEALQLAKEIGNIADESEAARNLWLIQKELGDPREALKMHELHLLLRDSMDREENHRAVLRREYQYDYEKQAITDSLEFARKEAVKDLELGKQQAELSKQRIGLLAAGGGLLLIGLLAFSIFKGKKRSDELLHNILPEEVATELKQKGKVGSKRIESVTVLFTDFKGFTSMAEKLTPRELVEDLNVCFSEFDRIMEKYGIEKIKTIGDAYMAAGGLPLPDEEHAQHVIQAAFEMRDFVEAGKARKIEAGLPYFEIRIGVHTGPVVAGIVGVKKFQYDIWGDTVNTASRMESSGEVGQVNISEATYKLVKGNSEFGFTSRGKIAAKGKGEMEMYFVERT